MMHLKRIARPQASQPSPFRRRQPDRPLRSRSPARRKPPRNVIFILADDHRYDLGSWEPFRGCRPALDRMARRSPEMRSHHVASRRAASILTGLFTHTIPSWTIRRRSPTIWSFPQYLQQNGYRTAFFGKWHGQSGRHAPARIRLIEGIPRTGDLPTTRCSTSTASA